MQENYLWKWVIKMYEDKLGIPPEITELLSVIDILLKCVQGLSNDTIARYTETSPEYVSNVLEKYLNFKGWSFDLDFSAIEVYNNCRSKEEFSFSVKLLSPMTKDMEEIYCVCQKYEFLERKLEEYGY